MEQMQSLQQPCNKDYHCSASNILFCHLIIHIRVQKNALCGLIKQHYSGLGSSLVTQSQHGNNTTVQA